MAEYNALLIRIQIAKEIGVRNLEAYDDSKLIVNQVRREYEVRHEDLVPYHKATIHMAEKFRNFYIDHVLTSKMHMQMHWHLLRPPWLFQPKQQRKYSSTIMTCTVQSSPLNMIKLQQETFKLKKL